MANRTLNMVKLKRAFQMLSASTPQREICAQLHIGRGVLNRYKKLADEAKVAYGTIGRMSEEQIHSLLQSAPTPKPSEQKKELDDLLPDYVDLCNFAVAFQNCIIEYVQSLRVGERNWYQFAHSHGMARKVRDFMVLKSSQP